MAQTTIELASTEKKGTISLRAAVFIGIGSMVVAGIIVLYGEARAGAAEG